MFPTTLDDSEHLNLLEINVIQNMSRDILKKLFCELKKKIVLSERLKTVLFITLYWPNQDEEKLVESF